MKFGLHWLILIALIVGVSLGMLFPTSYKITDSTISAFQNKTYPPELVHILQTEKRDYKESETEFLKRLKPALGPEYFEKYKKEVLVNSKFNPNLPFISWIGELYLRLLAMITIPLVVSGVISGLSNMGNLQSFGRIGLKTLAYFSSASAFAILSGLIFVNIFKPGLGFDISYVPKIDGIYTSHSFKDSLMNIVPVNIFDAFTGKNIISIIFFSIIFGYFVTRVHDRSRIFISNFFTSAFEVMTQITNFVVKLLPLALIGIVATLVADQAGDLQKIENLIMSLGKYILTVFLAFSFHAVITLPMLLYFGFKANPWKHFLKMRSALITAFFTSSSISTLPITIYSVHKKCGVSNKVANFTLPIGASISMDATALYQLIAVFFIAQAYGIELNLIETVIVIASTLLVSIGSSGMPLSGLFFLTTVLAAVGLPIEGIGLLVAIDRILEMFRTSMNVWSDSCGAVLIAKSEGEELKV